jgi:hypothetical protein
MPAKRRSRPWANRALPTYGYCLTSLNGGVQRPWQASVSAPCGQRTPGEHAVGGRQGLCRVPEHEHRSAL